MDKKDKEAFEKWFAQNPVNKFETEEAWQASCKHKKKEIDELKSTLVYVYDWYGMFMGDVAKDKIKKAVEGK